MASEWTVVLRFEDEDEPSEEGFVIQMEDDWLCVVVTIDQEEV